jgi:hypothetical protein
VNAGPNCAASTGSGFQGYQPELWTVKKDDIYAAIHAVQNGLEYARECLSTHETNLGRTTLKNKTWAERMEGDIRHMERTLAALRLCPNDLAHSQKGRERGPANTQD